MDVLVLKVVRIANKKVENITDEKDFLAVNIFYKFTEQRNSGVVTTPNVNI